MRAKNAPRTTKAYNYGIKAYSRLGHMGAVLTAYKDMINDQIEPDVETYRFLVESTLQSGSIRHARWSIYILWRLFVKEVPRIKPDTELINKFIECCGVCQEKERAIFFLSVFNDYRLVPNLETFKLLLQVIVQWIFCVPSFRFKFQLSGFYLLGGGRFNPNTPIIRL